MTIDKERLKDLAEAATGGVWQCEKDVQGRLHVTAGDFLDIAEVGYRSGPNPEADAQFMAAARPEVVLALLAEIERIELVSRLSCNHDGYMAVLAEREQLKAENEALRESANFRAIQSLRGDCEALRKDSERSKRMLLDACVQIGSIGEALGLDMDDDADMMIGTARDLIDGLNRIIKECPLGSPGFAIATEVMGELGVKQETQP